MQRRFILVLSVVLLVGSRTHAQDLTQDSTDMKCYVGSTLFLLGNFSSTNRPDFVQLNFGYWITPNEVISIEAKTWKYAWPLGIPYGKSFEAPEERYDGYIRDFGVALVYQRFWWKGFYTSVHAMNTLQKYFAGNGQHIQNGYMLFMTYRAGYHVPLFKNRLFIEPSIAMTHWPIRTNVPESFKVKENNWPNYFLFEPGLHFGFKF